MDDELRNRALANGMAVAFWAKRFPQLPAITSSAGDRSFAELNRSANRLVRALRARGVTSGQTLALVCGNRPEFAESVLAAQRGGLRLTPISRHLTAAEIAYIVDDSDAAALIVDASLPQIPPPNMLPTHARVRLCVADAAPGYERYDAALAEQPGDDIEDPQEGDRMLYTSGTTGRPKGVARGAMPPGYRPRTQVAAQYVAGPTHRHLCTGPLHHAAPLAFSLVVPLSEGVGVVTMDRWDAERCLQLIETHRITHTHMVPTMFHRLLHLPEAVRTRYDVSSVKFIVHGAAPCPIETKRAMIEWFGPVLWEYYAATEGSGTSISPEEWLEKPGSVGKTPSPDHVLILDDAGQRLAPGEIGTVYLKMGSSGRFAYHKDAEKTRSAQRGDHFTVGDIGYLDSDGYLFLTDRSEHLIISGGVNIYPAEVEAVLLQHPLVRDAAVIGVPDEEWGERVQSVIEANPGPGEELPSAEDLIAFCRERLASYKCPRGVDFVEKLPRQDNGKLYKRQLRAKYREANSK